VSETYRARTFVPPLAEEAEGLASELGFALSCRPEVGRLLYTLAASVRNGRVGEIGTGCGYGSAWMASALGPGGTLVTVEHDAERAAAAARLFAAMPNVQVLHADWPALLEHGPFDLLFVDGGRDLKPRIDGDGMPSETGVGVTHFCSPGQAASGRRERRRARRESMAWPPSGDQRMPARFRRRWTT
jgi:hypothetical protein